MLAPPGTCVPTGHRAQRAERVLTGQNACVLTGQYLRVLTGHNRRATRLSGSRTTRGEEMQRSCRFQLTRYFAHDEG